jgi:hypothetical protein
MKFALLRAYSAAAHLPPSTHQRGVAAGVDVAADIFSESETELGGRDDHAMVRSHPAGLRALAKVISSELSAAILVDKIRRAVLWISCVSRAPNEPQPATRRHAARASALMPVLRIGGEA